MADHEQEFLRGIFLMEAWDTVSTVEEGLSRLLDPRPSGESLAPLVVVAHRLRGAAGLHGFSGTAELAGLLEAVLEGAPVPAGSEPHGLVGDLVAAIKAMLDSIAATGDEDGAAVTLFRAGHPGLFEPGGPDALPSQRLGDRLLRETRRFLAAHDDVLVYFGPESAEHLEMITRALDVLERSGPDAEELHALFRALHTLKGAAYTVGCEAVGQIAHQAEDVLGAVRAQRLTWSPAVLDTLFRATDAIKTLLEVPDAPAGDPGAVIENAVRALAALPAPETAPADETSPVEALQATVSAEPEPEPEPVAPTPEPACVAAEASTESAAPRPARTTIRVSVGRLDALMNLVGELVIARSRLDRRFRQLERLDGLLGVSRGRMDRAVRDFEGKYLDPHLRFADEDVGAARPGGSGRDGFAPVSEIFAELEFDRYDDFNILARTIGELSADLGEIQAELAATIRRIDEDTRHVQRLTAGLRGEITRARMVPIGKLFARFPRRVHALAGSTGRTVRLEVSGESVEVDNAVMEQIADPLLHLVQNAVVHGIEPETERLARGKPAEGRIALTAYQRGGAIFVEVEDDGQGIDVVAVRELAVRRGMLAPEVATRLEEREVLSLLFLSGFSTATSVTDAAGRGVGLDVVRANIARVNGEVEVETRLGAGTRFRLRVPLALAISDALLVRAGGETFALPLSAVRNIATPERQNLRSVGRRDMVRVEGRLLDLHRLDHVLGLAVEEAGAESAPPVLVVRAGGRSFAVLVDAIVGKEEVVIKPIGGLLASLPPYGGATVTGEGRVILVLDPARLLTLAESPLAAMVEPRSAGAPSAARTASGTVRRVLLVDDSISVRRFVAQMLEKGGFEVLTANDGAEALERLIDTTVDVVVTDLEMPRVNGYELIENLRRRRSTHEVPVVVLTTRAGEKHWALARRLGVRHYVTKPVDEETFVRLVGEATATVPDAEPIGVLR
ncbi:MAG TPA: response regulator [Methylomirabilota bacterium]|nr:response regulator [Methylomirabilota bacterium]